MRTFLFPCAVSLASAANAPIFSSSGFYKQLASGIHSVSKKISGSSKASGSDKGGGLRKASDDGNDLNTRKSGAGLVNRIATSKEMLKAERRRDSRRKHSDHHKHSTKHHTDQHEHSAKHHTDHHKHSTKHGSSHTHKSKRYENDHHKHEHTKHRKHLVEILDSGDSVTDFQYPLEQKVANGQAVASLPPLIDPEEGEEIDSDIVDGKGGKPLVDGQLEFVHHKANAWWHYVLFWGLMALCLVCAAFFSGLTIGLLGLDVISLEIIAEGSHDASKRAMAKKVLPMRRKGNLLLTTLVFGNVTCNVVLSILIADVADGLIGAIISTVVIFIFAEIGPQALCHSYALPIGARLTWFTWTAMVLFYVVAKPIAFFMEWLIGEDIGTIHTRKELIQMLAVLKKNLKNISGT